VQRALAVLALKLGKLEQAGSLARDSIATAAATSSEEASVHSRQLLALIALQAGDARNAQRLLIEAGDEWRGTAESRPSLLTTEFLGDIHLEQGQAEPALKHYDEVWPKALALVPKGDIVAELRRRRAECYLLLGRHREAYDEARTGLEHCRELGDRYEEAATYRVLALAAAALGNPAEAKRWFDQGFAYYDDIETPYEWGKLWMSYGDWLAGSEAGEFADPAGAHEAYLAARDHFERMGAEARLAEAKARLARTAVATPAASPAVAARVEAERPRRRPRGSAELDRRSAWAGETFGFVTRNKIVLDLLGDVAKLAGAGSSLLILGESGTGKELVAHGVHRLSRRAGPFMPINAATLPREVIESELFGHVQGSFTGAHRDKPGLLEVCDGGTVFLDEIAEMSLELQSRLLRFLETGEIRRVGANRILTMDTLIVAATNRDQASLEKGEGFRPDLYYRLAHAVVVLPPLRRRGEDVELLVRHFFADACEEQQKRLTLSDEALRRLVEYPWPGNVRQLRAVLRRLAILAPPDHEIAGHMVHLGAADTASTLSEELEQAERRRMVEALGQTGGSRSDAARALGMARTTFVTKLKRYGIR
jgi:DNA-binding NtrC family response regulator